MAKKEKRRTMFPREVMREFNRQNNILAADDRQKPCPKNGFSILGVQEVADEDVNKYGIIAGEKKAENVYKVDDLVEKPMISEAPSNIAILGRYIINPGVFDILAGTKPGKGGEIQLTDALKVLAAQEEMYAYIFKGKRYDVGDKLGFLKATVEFALRRPELRKEFLEYLGRIVEKEAGSLGIVAAIKE